MHEYGRSCELGPEYTDPNAYYSPYLQDFRKPAPNCQKPAQRVDLQEQSSTAESSHVAPK